ncbi:hypothetical protein AB1399_03575 [Hydrogenibacillus schlegelii]|uniref:hypothetical protein n=1 Tax=Hydrogenibacillus schlegelii TaxID=1484 RepID=UPI0012E354F0|nr:hypothetical protein [Hydrogenibacillus schlegelii]
MQSGLFTNQAENRYVRAVLLRPLKIIVRLTDLDRMSGPFCEQKKNENKNEHIKHGKVYQANITLGIS